MYGQGLLQIYYALFHSIATYGILAWGSSYKNVILPLVKMQNRMLKIIVKKNNKITQPLTLNATYDLECLSYYYTRLRSRFLTSNSVTRSRQILLPKLYSKTCHRSSYIQAIKIYNKLHNEHKSIQCISMKTLKKKLRKILYAS